MPQMRGDLGLRLADLRAGILALISTALAHGSIAFVADVQDEPPQAPILAEPRLDPSDRTAVPEEQGPPEVPLCHRNFGHGCDSL